MSTIRLNNEDKDVFVIFEEGKLTVKNEPSVFAFHELNETLDSNKTKLLYESMRDHYEPDRAYITTSLVNRIKDILMKDDGQAYEEAEKLLERMGEWER